MKNLALVITVAALIFSLVACAGKTTPKPDVSGEVATSSAHIDEEATENSKDTGLNYVGSNDFDNGFPSHMPLYEGFEVVEMDAYGDDGYMMIYDVKASYDNVVGYYMMNIPGLDEAGIGDDESYFEGADFDGIYIKGLTITDNKEYTTVYITLEYAVDGYTEDDNEDSDEFNGITEDYDTIVGTTPDKGYPEDIVPLYPSYKLTYTSSIPGEMYIMEGVAAPGSYDDAVKFYSDLFGSSKSFESQLMKSEEFTGEKNGWKYQITVVYMPSSDICDIQFTLQK